MTKILLLLKYNFAFQEIDERGKCMDDWILVIDQGDDCQQNRKDE